MATPVANQPCESGRRVWDSLRSNEEPQAGVANEQDARTGGSRVGGGPNEEDRRRGNLRGYRAPHGSSHHGRDMAGMSAPDVCRIVPTFFGPSGGSGVLPKMAPARTEADAINIPGLPAPPQFRHRMLWLGDKVAGASWRGIRLGHGDRRRGWLWDRSTTVGRSHQFCVGSLSDTVWRDNDGHQ